MQTPCAKRGASADCCDHVGWVAGSRRSMKQIRRVRREKGSVKGMSGISWTAERRRRPKRRVSVGRGIPKGDDVMKTVGGRVGVSVRGEVRESGLPSTAGHAATVEVRWVLSVLV